MESMVPSGWGKSLGKPMTEEACGRVIEAQMRRQAGRT